MLFYIAINLSKREASRVIGSCLILAMNSSNYSGHVDHYINDEIIYEIKSFTKAEHDDARLGRSNNGATKNLALYSL